MKQVIQRIRAFLKISNANLKKALKEAFFSSKINKSTGHYDISYIIKKCFGEICYPIEYFFNLSLEQRVFPDIFKTAKVTPFTKANDTADLSNYRLISALPCSSLSEKCIIAFINVY